MRSSLRDLAEQPGSAAPQTHTPFFLSSRDAGKATAHPTFASLLRKGLLEGGGQLTELPAPRFCPSFFLLLGWGMGPAWLVTRRAWGGGVGQRWGSCQASLRQPSPTPSPTYARHCCPV